MESPKVVILGAGIMGLSAAFYLSGEIEGSNIHIFDPSPKLFDCASGNAAGFLAKDWFSSSAMLKLGALSLAEHKRVAEENHGRKLWGYTEGRAISYQEASCEKGSENGDDWLWEGGSRSGVAPSGDGDVKPTYRPVWLHPGTTEDLSSPGGTAQVNPRDLCEFLLRTCKERGVNIHQPAHVQSVSYDSSGNIAAVEWSSSADSKEFTTQPCSHILIAAGPWTPQTFSRLFPSTKTKPQLPIYPLAGWSVNINIPSSAPLPTSSDAVFASRTSQEGFAPEFFTRPRSVPQDSTDPARWDIWLGGLNSSTEPLPDASVATAAPPADDEQIQSLLSVANRIFTYTKPKAAGIGAGIQDSHEEGAQLISAALCFRPATKTGRPIIGRVPSSYYISKSPTDEVSRGKDDTSKGGLFICSGHGPWGIALSLGSGKVISEIMLHGDRDKVWESLGLPVNA